MRLAARSTAVLTMELQRGVCGDEARWPALRDAVTERRVEAQAARLLAAARAAGVAVLHCTFSIRPDRADTDFGLPLLRAVADDPTYLAQGSTAVALLPALGPEPGDVVVERHHGVSPFGGTALDGELRSRGIDTVVVAGVSLNVGVPGTAIEAVNAGYRVVIAADAVVGIPLDYGDAVLRHCLPAVATVAVVDDVIAALARG